MKTGGRVLVVLVSASLLTACATQAQQQANTIVATVQAANFNIQSCVTAAVSKPQYAPLLTHAPINPTEPSLAQISDEHFASKEEIAILFSYDAEAQVCRKAFLDQLQTVVPTVAAIVAEGYTKLQNNLLDLIKKKQTWGHYAKNRRDIALESVSRQNAEYQRIGNGLTQANDAELTRRQAAASAFMQYYQTQQIINNMNRPTVTNCNTNGTITGNTYGGSTNCITH